ncbi:MAG: hypothetical protein HYV07_21230 [Deltaproteobacteria bacterium]|nr:hypothetical protein [Deltaproteobacteria bacterium]
MTRLRIARFVSIAGHPFLLIPGSIAIATSSAAGTNGYLVLLALVLVSLSLVGAVVLLGRARGWWSHVDVPERERRAPLYGVAIATTLSSTFLLDVFNHPRVVVAGSVIATAMLAIAFVVNRYALKVSLHTAMAVYAAGILGPNPGGALFFAVAIAVAWSRVTLGRHTRNEVAAGLALGTAASAVLLVSARG